MGDRLIIEGHQLYRIAHFADAAEHQGPLTHELAAAWATTPTAKSPPSLLTASRRIEVLMFCSLPSTV